MKLKNYLAKLDDKQIVSIGAKNGNSYMYIGEAGNVKLICSLFEAYRDSVVKRLGKLEKKEQTLAMTIPKMEYDQTENENRIHKFAKEIAMNYMNIENNKAYLRNYVDPLKREVVETGNRDQEEGIRVIISGQENGKFWFKSEFDKQNG